MKISFPACKANGEQYATLDEMMALVGREPHGSWLAGTNRMWHGGLHITQISAPGSVMNAETLDTVVPLQCMADGEVVAWRLGQKYKENTYNGQKLQYSSTFVLVKSTCLPDTDKPQTQLDFYSLYMGLAPLSAFQKCKCMKAKTRVKTRKAGVHESSQGAEGPAPAPEKEGYLEKNNRVLILKETTFMNGPDEQPFGLAQKLDSNGNVTGGKFWVTLLPDFMAEDGEQYAHLPFWMQHAVTAGTFDSVAKPVEKLEIKAGDAIGFLGEDIVPVGMGQISSSTYAHIEVLSADSRMPAFLDNPGAVTAGQKFISIKPESLLYTNSGDTFTQTSAKVGTDIHRILPTDKCNPKESGGKKYYQISEQSWLSQDEVEEVNQYDLKKQGFAALVQESTSDMSTSLTEEWVKGAFEAFSEQVVPGRGIHQQQVSEFYKAMIDRLDSDQDGDLSGVELYNAVHHPEMGIRDIAARLTVKHESEWYGGSSAPKWTKFFENYDPVRVDFAKKWLDDVGWMSQVEPFSEGEAVWHMHPIVFLSSLSEDDSQVVFPLVVKPENDPSHLWEHYDWRNMHHSNMATFGANRGQRKHAARDLYTKPHAKVVAICDGIVLITNPFYCKTNEVTVLHKTKDGREFIARYGELDPHSITVRQNEKVIKGQHIGDTGELLNAHDHPLLVLNGKTVFMLHFELYSGNDGYNLNHPLTDRQHAPFLRRSDLIDPIEILSEGYENTFNKGQSTSQRLDTSTLTTSDFGKDFIKAWEALGLTAYNDSKGYCTIGYGHLIDKNRCENITLPSEYQSGITSEKANDIFAGDLVSFENAVKRNIHVKLYQYEFDALVSLLFNCGQYFFDANKAPKMLAFLNSEKYDDAAAEFLDINNGGDAGLSKRRRAEHNIFHNNVYDSTH